MYGRMQRRKEENKTDTKGNQGQECMWFHRAREQCKENLLDC